MAPNVVEINNAATTVLPENGVVSSPIDSVISKIKTEEHNILKALVREFQEAHATYTAYVHVVEKAIVKDTENVAKSLFDATAKADAAIREYVVYVLPKHGADPNTNVINMDNGEIVAQPQPASPPTVA